MLRRWYNKIPRSKIADEFGPPPISLWRYCCFIFFFMNGTVAGVYLPLTGFMHDDVADRASMIEWKEREKKKKQEAEKPRLVEPPATAH